MSTPAARAQIEIGIWTAHANIVASGAGFY
jgi:hypothetical protein